MNIRYHISDEIVQAMSGEQILAQKSRMVETGRWIEPNGGNYILRCSTEANNNLRRTLLKDTVAYEAEPGHIQYCDFEYQNGKIARTTLVVKRRVVHASAKQRALILKQDHAADAGPSIGQLPEKKWWEKDWFCAEFEDKINSNGTLGDSLVHHALIICLQDRNTIKVETKPSGLQKLGIGKPRPDRGMREIAIYCPAHAKNEYQGGTHASPHMHYRAEHDRNQPYGEGQLLRKKITVPATWVNADELPEGDRDPPLMRRYQLRR